MRKACRKMWRVVPCTSRTYMRTESRKDIEEILKTKLATIKEEPAEMCEENVTPPRHRRMAKKGKKIPSNVKKGRLFAPQFSLHLRNSYELFLTGFASKGSFGGLIQY